jgi:hypothetical protein
MATRAGHVQSSPDRAQQTAALRPPIGRALANNASPLVILAVLDEELTKRVTRYTVKLVN